jgi:hypothetical protein
MQLRAVLQQIFSESVDAVLDDTRFNRIALDIFAYQFERNAPYRAYCERRNRNPGNVADWTAIPAVPTAAFKHVDLVAGDKSNAEAVYRTSGTTAGLERRGTNYVLDLSLYNCSLIPGFAARLLPDAAELPMLSLIPSADEMTDSSLAHMVAVVMQRLGTADSAYFATAMHGIDAKAIESRLRDHIAADTPVCILGTSFSFVHWIDDMASRGIHFALPTGSRLMDTGGYKGRSREVPAEVMLTSYEELLGIPREACVNEYGMTELCSQMYDVTLAERVRSGAVGRRRKRPPPWMRIRIVDAVTLEPVPDGAPGLVQIFDLANIGSVICVQTEDLGVQIDDGFAILGRAPGAQPRGCSIAMDDMLQAQRRP